MSVLMYKDPVTGKWIPTGASSGGGGVSSEELANHIANNNVHVTTEDRNNWDNKASTDYVDNKIEELGEVTHIPITSEIPDDANIWLDPDVEEDDGYYTKAEIDYKLKHIGGGGGGLLPQIIVTAEPGSTVTCTKGDIVLTAEEVDGTWTFDVPEYGEWVVTSGYNTQTVFVNTVMQYYVVMYDQLINYTMLYDCGDECAQVTGGWGVSGATKQALSINITNPNNGYTSYGCHSINNFDTTGYSHICSVSDCTASTYSNPVYSGSIQLYSDAGFRTGTQVLASNGDEPSGVGNNQVKILSLENFQPQNIYLNFSCYYCAVNLREYFAVKADDAQMLCSMVGISQVSSLSDLIVDVEKISKILENENAVKFMVLRCTGDFMAYAVQSSTFLTALESSPYKELVYANEHWAKFLAMVA